MKKVLSSFITSTALQPFKQGTWEHLQSSYTEAIAAMGSGVATDMASNKPYIIYGLIKNTGMSNVTVTAGAVFYNGEIYLVDAVTLALPSGNEIVLTTAVSYYTDPKADPTTMTDGSTPNVHQINKVVLVNGTTGTTNYIGKFIECIRMLPPTYQTFSPATWGTPRYIFTFEYNRIWHFTPLGNATWEIGLSYDGVPAFGAKQSIPIVIGSGSTIQIINTSPASILYKDAGSQDISVSYSLSGATSGYFLLELTYLGKDTSGNNIVLYKFVQAQS